jgi:phenylalanyl-tRNA synthetase beta chain
MKISYKWLQNYFEEKLPEPEVISNGIIFHSFEVDDMEKVGDDTVFDIKILPDRAHDCLSHFGIAKEVSAIFDLKIKDKEIKVFEQKSTELKIEIEDSKCLRYMGRIVRNIKVSDSPDWLKEKLNVIGQKSINNIVDAANFVMFDLGQPIHCFDLDKLESSKIIVRNGRDGEKLTTLDKKEINLNDTILVIADEKDPLAIAGIKGGTKAEVDNNTKNIVIEVANFNPTTTRKTAKKIGILTDAVKRYENEITPELCSITMDSITDMIYTLAGGTLCVDMEIEDILDIYPNKQEQKIVTVSVDYINKRLGSNFSKEEIESVWKKLNFEYTDKIDGFEIKIPFLRIDLNESYDLVEEVIRILGYDRLEEKLPEIKIDTKVNEAYYKMLWIRNKLLTDGYSEIMNYAFRDKGEVEVLASASNKKFLRNNLTDGLKESVKLNTLNTPLLGIKDVRIFEIGTVFSSGKEEMHVAYGDKKGIVEMTSEEYFSINCPLEQSMDFHIDKFISFISHEANYKAKEFKPWSLYPFITRDIACWVPEDTKPNTLFDIYKELGTELLIKDPELVDKFQKQDKISYAYRLVFQSYERTLTDEEITNIMSKITDKINSIGFEVR